MDLLSSGPERPRGEHRIWRRRGVRVAVVVVAAAAALVLLRSTVHTGPSTVDRPVAQGSTAAPRPVAPLPTPPFDRRPGRTPIPAPAAAGDALSGPLPATGALGRPAAVRAAALVLGRYCLNPQGYAATMGPGRRGAAEDWHHVDVLVFSLERSNSGPVQRLALDWDGRSAYRWRGSGTLLTGCG